MAINGRIEQFEIGLSSEPADSEMYVHAHPMW